MLSEAVNRHIELYRARGFKYKVQAYILRSYAVFAQGRSERFIQTDTVLEWAALAPSVRQRYDRLLTMRRRACVLRAEDERHEVAAHQGVGGLAIFSLRTKSTACWEPLPCSPRRDRFGQSHMEPRSR
jgi:hypothetical protein